MEERTVIEWDKDDLEALGLLKVDVLGLGMLSCLRRGFDLLRIALRRSTIAILLRACRTRTKRTPVYRMIQRADTIGVFQIESRAQMSMLPRLRPKEFYDLVIEVAIVRPGPIQGNMVHPYLQRREKLRDKARSRLSFARARAWRQGRAQGDPAQDARRAAVPGAGDAHRHRGGGIHAGRGRPAAPRHGDLQARRHHRELPRQIHRRHDRDAATTRDFAERCFSQIEGFGEYGFPESHAASFANPGLRLVPGSNATTPTCSPPRCSTASRWASMRRRRSCATRRSMASRCGRSTSTCRIGIARWRPGRSGRASVLHPRHADDERRHPLHPCLRLGFRQISGFSEDARPDDRKRARRAASIRCAISGCARGCRPPRSNGSPRPTRSARSASTAATRCGRCARLQRAGDKDDLPLFARVAMPELEPDVELPPMPPGEQVVEDYRHLHLSLKAHPVSFLRADLDRARHPAPRAACRACRPAGASRSPASCWCASGPAPPRRHLHDAGGRDRHRQHDRVAADVRDIPPGRARRAADQRDRQAAERVRRDPCGGRADRGSHAAAAPPVGKPRLRGDARALPTRSSVPSPATARPSTWRRNAPRSRRRPHAPATPRSAAVMPKGRNFH